MSYPGGGRAKQHSEKCGQVQRGSGAFLFGHCLKVVKVTFPTKDGPINTTQQTLIPQFKQAKADVSESMWVPVNFLSS
jgi:hypothetical protein